MATQAPIKLVDPLPYSAQSAIIPVLMDFAILKLQGKPKTPIIPNPLLRGKPLPSIGAEIIFSGYPLGAPIMLTHKGMISGITNDQAVMSG
jgi:hypothetical protein